MSKTMLNILDGNSAIHGTIQRSLAERIVAALSAEPETILELQDALGRFQASAGDVKTFAAFSAGTSDERRDSGIVYIDLAARIVSFEWSSPGLQLEGYVRYHDGVKSTEIQLPYYLSDDWWMFDTIAEYEAICAERRAEFASSPHLDARPILFGAISEFVVAQCLAARDSKTGSPIPEIHARWLMTPRQDLQGRSPRDVLLEKLLFIDLDLQSRELQCSRLGRPVKPLSQNSAAYRFASFGTHSAVVYYDFVRFLLEECWQRVSTDAGVVHSDEVERLDRLKEDWLARPDPELGDTSPAYVLECERLRVPLLVSAKEAMIDDDCPCCNTMAEFGPAFWHLDGSNMDPDFPFSFCRTRDEWEKEERLLKEAEEASRRRCNSEKGNKI